MRPIKRGDIFSVDFEPVHGSGQGNVRPALVIQNDIGKQHSPTVIVAPLTTGATSRFPVNVAVAPPEGGLANPSLILLNQIRTIDKARLGRRWGHLSPAIMAAVDEAIRISLGLVPL